MRLTLHTDFSLRVLIYLGLEPGRLATIQEVALHYGISRNHLMKVVHRLGAAGYIRTVRGKNGGMTLQRPPARIGLGAVVRSMEDSFELVECFSPDGRCRIRPACSLRAVLLDALAGFFQVLDRYTLADVISNPDELSWLLELTDRRPPGLKGPRMRRGGKRPPPARVKPRPAPGAG